MKILLILSRIVIIMAASIAIAIILSGEYDDVVNLTLTFFTVLMIIAFAVTFPVSNDYRMLNADIEYYEHELNRLYTENQMLKAKQDKYKA